MQYSRTVPAALIRLVPDAAPDHRCQRCSDRHLRHPPRQRRGCHCARMALASALFSTASTFHARISPWLTQTAPRSAPCCQRCRPPVRLPRISRQPALPAAPGRHRGRHQSALPRSPNQPSPSSRPMPPAVPSPVRLSRFAHQPALRPRQAATGAARSAGPPATSRASGRSGRRAAGLRRTGCCGLRMT